jgi:hypothetical protein
MVSSLRTSEETWALSCEDACNTNATPGWEDDGKMFAPSCPTATRSELKIRGWWAGRESKSPQLSRRFYRCRCSSVGGRDCLNRSCTAGSGVRFVLSGPCCARVWATRMQHARLRIVQLPIYRLRGEYATVACDAPCTRACTCCPSDAWSTRSETCAALPASRGKEIEPKS